MLDDVNLGGRWGSDPEFPHPLAGDADWWSLYVRRAVSGRHIKGISRRPAHLYGISKKTSHCNQGKFTITSYHGTAEVNEA